MRKGNISIKECQKADGDYKSKVPGVVRVTHVIFVSPSSKRRNIVRKMKSTTGKVIKMSVFRTGANLLQSITPKSFS